MKKLILLALVAVVMVGCEEDDTSKYGIKVYDSCEYIYIKYEGKMTHKGNCKFCAQRRKQELRELIKELKER